MLNQYDYHGICRRVERKSLGENNTNKLQNKEIYSMRERESTIIWNVGSGACVQACGLNAASQCFWHSVHAAVCACVLGESKCNCFSLFDMQMYSFIHSIIWFRTHQVTDIWQFCNNHLSYFSKQMKQGWYITH